MLKDYGTSNEKDEKDHTKRVSFADDGSFHIKREKRSSLMEHQHSPRTLEEQATHLSMRLLEIDSDDEDAQEEILNQTLLDTDDEEEEQIRQTLRSNSEHKAQNRVLIMVSLSALAVLLAVGLTLLSFHNITPPNQPIGPYRLLERQEGEDFFDFYQFYEGPDSVGSNGFNNYVSEATAKTLGIANVTFEDDEMVFLSEEEGLRQRRQLQNGTLKNPSPNNNRTKPFIYMKSAPTPDGPRQSIRLEGKRRFHRGLFIIDLRHMPAGCGVWPAFWMTDEANWPINGEIDIVEGVNYQSEAKTALHSTKGCSMRDVPVGVKTGSWDTAIGIPDKKTGIPDMTIREATNCFVYDPHQWLNQGCVAVDTEGDSLGGPVNDKGGGVYVLEWDPVNRHIRTWVFSPHTRVPENLRQSIETASEEEDENRVVPDPELWPLPYGYFTIGDGTLCAASHFKNMRLVFNMAFCGSVAGNRFQMDCPKQAKKFETCNDWIASEPKELDEAYWKVRGVYVYEREWESTKAH